MVEETAVLPTAQCSLWLWTIERDTERGGERKIESEQRRVEFQIWVSDHSLPSSFQAFPLDYTADPSH